MRTVASGGALFGAGAAARVLATSTAASSAGAQIARSLGLSVKIVQNYVSRILDKLQVADRTQAALRARDAWR